MKFFKITYKVKKSTASTILEAKNKMEAIEKFQHKKIGVLRKVEEVSEPLSYKIQKLLQTKNNPIKKRPVDTQRLIAILDQLAIMLDAGLPLNYVLAESVKNEKDTMLKNIFSNILISIEGGKSFYEAALPYKAQLGFLTLSMIRLGEETGQIAESLVHLRNILQNILDNRQKFKKATRYPMFIIFAMGVAFTIVITMVVPQFKSFFEASKMELPLPTQFLLWMEHSLTAYGPYILLSGVAFSLFLAFFYKKDPRFRLFMDRFLLRIYIIGKATLNAMISRYLYVFNVLVESGIPMINALNIANEIVDNSYIRQQMQHIPLAIEDGKSLNQGFKEAELFDDMVVEMIKAGEIGGGLGKMLEKATKIYKDRFDYIVDNIAALIEPILITAIAGFVLVLAMGIFMPMWNMIDVSN